jgi:hypothetical protein
MAARKTVKKTTKPVEVCVRIELAISCGRCMRPLVLDRIEAQITCRACLHTRPLATSDWAYMARSGVAEALDGSEEAGSLCTDFGDEYTVRSRIAPAHPTCGGCGKAIALDTLSAGASAGSVTCACGTVMRVRVPDELVRAIAPTAVVIANESVDEGPSQNQIAFRCGCHASLSADGRVRSVVCAKCGPVDVPEALWNVLRPIRRRSPIFLVLGKGH